LIRNNNDFTCTRWLRNTGKLFFIYCYSVTHLELEKNQENKNAEMSREYILPPQSFLSRPKKTDFLLNSSEKKTKFFFLQKCEKSIIVLNWNTLIYTHTHTSKWVNIFRRCHRPVCVIGKRKQWEKERKDEWHGTQTYNKWTLYKFGY
jgi:hypothetical protein